MQDILLGTQNVGKMREMKALLVDLPIRLVTPAQLGLHLDVPELGATYTENASHKAQVYAQVSGLITLADDSGLEVDALGGMPGLHSARFSPRPGATDADRRRLLLDRLSGFPQPWTAQFRCVVAIASPDGVVQTREGICNGEIISEERGQGGFGYDPIFFITELGRTMAELSMDEKNTLSHRARAVLAARPVLQSFRDPFHTS
jgi:XTP/dITP diphosphohydrolase